MNDASMYDENKLTAGSFLLACRRWPRRHCAHALIGRRESVRRRKSNPKPQRAASRVKPAHRRAPAKRVIQLFMNGGASQMDLFDYKPELLRRHGTKFDTRHW